MSISEISDKREIKEFRKISFSNFKKTEVKKELLNNLKNSKLEQSCYWCAELLCAGHFLDVWDLIIHYMSKFIYLGNPKLPLYINVKLDLFKKILNKGYIDNILNTADPLYLVSAQKHAKKRITNSIVKFKDFTYKANFDYKKEKDISEFSETFKDDATSNVRQNVHTLYMETQKKILQIAKSKGFILHGKIDMVGCMYEYQYLYILQKPK